MQTSKESIIGFREDIISTNRTSSFLGDQPYGYVDVTREDGSSQMHAVYYDMNDVVLLEENSPLFLQLQRNILYPSVDSIRLRYRPYQLGCIISDGAGDILQESMLELVGLANPQTYCFAINTHTCMVQEVSCPE